MILRVSGLLPISGPPMLTLILWMTQAWELVWASFWMTKAWELVLGPILGDLGLGIGAGLTHSGPHTHTVQL